MEEGFNIWEGIYTSFQDAEENATGGGFSSDVYNERALNAALECMRMLKSGKPIPSFHKQRSTLLPVTAGMMLSRTKNLSILDFGGGLGIGYMVLAESIPDYSKKIKYEVVELPDICKQGQFIHHEENIYFSSALPSTGQYDLVHSSSALQYIEDWKSLVRKWSSYKSEYILLSDVLAGDIPTFVTLQNYYGSKIKSWFFNLDSLVSVFNEMGYYLQMKTQVNGKRLDFEDTLPMKNFPETHRIEFTLHLLFHKIIK